MKSFKSQRLASLSRQGRFQFFTVLLILGAGALVASLLGLRAKSPDDFEGLLEKMHFDWLSEQSEIHSRADAVNLLRHARELRKEYDAQSHEGQWKLHDEKFILLLSGEQVRPFLREAESEALDVYLRAMRPKSSPTETTLQSMETAAASDPASGLIASMQGDLLRLMEKGEDALAAYQRGAADAETGYDCRARALILCVRRHWQDRLQALYAQAGWRETIRSSSLMEWEESHDIMVAAGDWTGLLWHTTTSLAHSLQSPAWVTLALGCGIVWFLLIHVAAGVRLRRWWLGGAAFLLGIASIPLTLFFITLQHHYFGIESGDSPHESVFYCISGIGFREELAKLICFAPLLPFLRGKTTPVHVLVVASCVGLGFAIEENINYFAGSTGTAVFGRFVTANFIHIALTGLSGLALWLAVKSPSKWLQHFTVVFVGAVCFHGLWDWSPPDERMVGDYSYLLYAGFVGIAYYYFGELQRFRGIIPGVPSPAWIFLCGIALLMALTMCVVSSIVGFRFGFVLTLQGSLGLFVIGAAMYYQLRGN